MDDKNDVINYDFILSIDVGIKNCSYIILRNNYHKDNTVDNIATKLDIDKFKNLDFSNGENCNSISLMQLNNNIIKSFKEEFDDFFNFTDRIEAEVLILIEDQMSGRMKCIQNMMASYFIINHYGYFDYNIVFFVSPKQKLKPFNEKGQDHGGIPRQPPTSSGIETPTSSGIVAGCNNHNKNKNKANFIMDNKMIPLMKAECLDGDGNPKVFEREKNSTIMERPEQKVFNMNNFIDYYNGLKKQDDMADAFLQALYYLLNPFTSAENKLINNRYFK